jgi:hypothetical protein
LRYKRARPPSFFLNKHTCCNTPQRNTTINTTLD